MAETPQDLVDNLLDSIDRTAEHLKARRAGLTGEARQIFSDRIDQLAAWREDLVHDPSRATALCAEACEEWVRY